MGQTLIIEGPAARSALVEGARALAEAVGPTLGPRGRAAILGGPDGPTVTTDGAEVAGMVRPDEPHAALGASLLAGAARRILESAGTGATTTILLAHGMADGITARLEDGADGVELERGVEEAVRAVVADLRARSEAVDTRDELLRVATTAALGDDDVARVAAQALTQMGKEAPVVVLEGDAPETVLEPSQGLRFRGTLLVPDPDSAGNDGLELADPWVVISAEPVPGGALAQVLEIVASGDRPLVLVASDFEDEALEVLRSNQARGGLQIAAVRAAAVGDRRKAVLQDLATLTGALVISRETGRDLDSAALPDMGRSPRVVAEPRATTFVGGAGAHEVRHRIHLIRSQIDAAPEGMQTWLKERLAALAGGVAVIRVGGSSLEEIRRRRDRAEGVLQAVRVAAAEGVVPGGGVALHRAGEAVNPSSASTPDSAAGMELVREALTAPLRQIAENAWADGDEVVVRVRGGTGAFGFDARTREFVDLDQAGLHDPTLMLRLALEEASDFARLVLNAGVAVVREAGGRTA